MVSASFKSVISLKDKLAKLKEAQMRWQTLYKEKNEYLEKEIEKLTSLKKYKKKAVLDGNSFVLSTKGVKNKKCVFFKNNKCSICGCDNYCPKHRC